MTLEEFAELIIPRLDRIETKLDQANGRSQKNAWNIGLIWRIFGGLWAVTVGVFLVWLRAHWGSQ